MKSVAIALCSYGTFLILAGLVGFLSNPEKAKTALLSGGTFGLFNIGLGWLALRDWRPTVRVALWTAGFLAVVFIWRSTVTWMAVAEGKPEKTVAGIIITTMLAGTLGLFVYLAKARKRMGAPSH